MVPPADIAVSLVSFAACGDALLAIRREVFVAEQGVPEAIEIDGVDGRCVHVLASQGDLPVGTGRMQADGHIGRIAVRKPFRGLGVGTRMVRALIAEARRRGLASVYLGSQIHAQGFYEELGFVAYGEAFMEAGIPHIMMRLALV